MKPRTTSIGLLAVPALPDVPTRSAETAVLAPTTLLAVVAVLAVAAFVAPIPGAAQEPFEGWMRVHSDSTYESYVAPGSWAESEGDADSLKVVRLIANRMLVRRLDEGRALEIRGRAQAGLPTEGYDRYSATTRVLEIRCHTRRVSVWEVTDRDAEGKLLDRRILEREWRTPESLDDEGATAAIVAWACRPRSRSPVGSSEPVPTSR